MMTHACGSRTDGLSFIVPIYINQDNRSVEPFVDKELPQTTYLLLSKCLLRMGICTNRAIDIVPQIGSTLASYTLNMPKISPAFRQARTPRNVR